MIYGLSPISSGELFVFGEDIKTKARIIKARIGVCQQENTLDPDLTVMQNFEVFARYFNLNIKTARQRASELLQFLPSNSVKTPGQRNFPGEWCVV